MLLPCAVDYWYQSSPLHFFCDSIRMEADPLIFCWIVFDGLPAQCAPRCERVTFTGAWLAAFVKSAGGRQLSVVVQHRANKQSKTLRRLWRPQTISFLTALTSPVLGKIILNINSFYLNQIRSEFRHSRSRGERLSSTQRWIENIFKCIQLPVSWVVISELSIRVKKSISSLQLKQK